MIIKPELVKRIKDYFNLNIYETKVWMALLSKGLVSAGETAELSGVPRSRTYDVLESLAKRGFAIIKIGKPVRYIAIEPKTVLEKMKTNVLNQATDKVHTLDNLKDKPEYTELVQLYKSGITPIKLEDLSGHIKGRSNIISKLKELVGNAEKEIIILTTIDDFEDKTRVITPILNKIMADKDVKVKISLSGDPFRIKRLSTRNDIKIKEVDHTGRFFISDKKEILFMVSAENSEEETGIWINSPYFANSFANIFEKHLKS